MIDNRVPALPAPWRVESARAAGGGADVSGDFVVAEHRDDGVLDLVVVDVSGRGDRASDLAHELDELMKQTLADVPSADFLATVNAELAARDWGEGFATAVHLVLDPGTGRFEVRSAGHPAPAHRTADGWGLVRCEGPVLGLLPGASYDAVSGRLDPGEALLLYTDGMVEEPGRDIDRGIDQMLAAAEQTSGASYDGLAGRLLATVGSATDDRALLLLHRV